MKQTFGKSERLSDRRIMDKLFTRGSTEVKSFYLFPFRVLYLTDETHVGVLPKVLFSISRKSFKHAVDRNLLRRRCREAYRRNKFLLTRLPAAKHPAYLAFLYIAKEKLEFSVMETSMIRLFKKLGIDESP